MKKFKLVNAAFIMLIAVTTANAQEVEVEIKKDKVLLDGKEFLKYEKENVWNQSFYSLGDGEEIIHYRFNNNGTDSYFEDDYFILNFLNEKIKIESSQTSRTTVLMSTKKSSEKLIKWLLKDKVLNADGTINKEKLDNFYDKYNEDITNRTVRY